MSLNNLVIAVLIIALVVFTTYLLFCPASKCCINRQNTQCTNQNCTCKTCTCTKCTCEKPVPYENTLQPQD